MLSVDNACLALFSVQVTRAAYLLEEVSKEVLVRIRKTRVGKRCKEEWLLRGLEKHVKPLVNLDQSMTDQLGLGSDLTWTSL